MDAKSRVLFVREPGSERWTFEVHEFAAFKEALGSDVLNAFCRCFVHTDRLTSLIGFAYLSKQFYGTNSRAFERRDLHTMVWFVVGTLRELAMAIRKLRSALAKRGVLDPDSQPWVTLRDVEKRWEDDPIYRKMRSIVAFHVDPDVIGKGLEALAKQSHVVIIEGEGQLRQNTNLPLGLEALYMGLNMDVSEFDRFMVTVVMDLGVASAIQKAFLLALDTASVPFEEAPNGA